MGIQSFFKAQKGDPDWAFTPEQYFDREFKLIDANLIELGQGKTDKITLRQTPCERELLAKNLHVDVRENATLDLTIINDASDKLQQVFIYDIRIREGGHLNFGLFAKGGKLNKHILQVTLDDGANFNSYGYAANWVGGDCEIITKVYHKGTYSESNQFILAEAGVGSQTVYQGMVNIDKDATYATAGIENINVLSGEGARCHGLPEIYNDNDKAKTSAGVTTECIDRDQIYYLQSRGINYDTAEAMILSGYRDQVLHIIQSDELREEILQLFTIG